ncbi:GNAT family N-acetyltransferase [Actinokineospora auranticolor]|uniref:RimJ/RimL family protein N-acetyltransferase n=1 Tax=Actinokineospora auranticolor TaxID=155976 RepID=A0A2S6GNQ2_9PSEU|nr:GNAT family N-acetyltransferase [Actinokineospora auranticolor]PPK66810.1 RimJ/RimL family protein N-acetyltransferase [Actinokineospora auranticolor]
MIRVRTASPGDGAALGEIHAASWAAAYGPFFAADFAEAGVRDRRDRWHARVGADLLLLATLDDRPLALSYSVDSPTRPGLAELHSFYAHPDAWGTGVAQALVTETLRRLSAYPAVHLWTLEGTPRSRRFYTKSGFTPTGATRPHDFGDGNPLPQLEYERTL